MADVEALNTAAFAGEADVTKLSYHAYAYCVGRLRAARRRQRARARNCGPLLDLQAGDRARRSRRGSSSGSPFPEDTRPPISCSAWRFRTRANRTELRLLGDRSRRCWTDEYDAGADHPREPVHLRGQGAEEDRRSRRVLGSETGAPIPLGGIVVRRSLPDEVKQRVNRVMRRSVEYAFAHPRRQPAVRARARAGDERRGDVPAHRPVRERVLRRSRRGRAARGGGAVRARPRGRRSSRR